MQADVTNNGTVNVIDLQQTADQANERPPLDRMDQNANGVVNVIDLLLVAQRQGESVLLCP